MEEITLEELKNDDAYNDYIDELLWNDYIETDEYKNETRYEDITEIILKLQKERETITNNLKGTEEKYFNFLYKGKPNQDMKEFICQAMEKLDSINNVIYGLIEELEEL